MANRLTRHQTQAVEFDETPRSPFEFPAHPFALAYPVKLQRLGERRHPRAFRFEGFPL
jgi:hypothetical protein